MPKSIPIGEHQSVSFIAPECFNIVEAPSEAGRRPVQLEKDPVTYLLRSASALSVLKALEQGEPVSMAKVRKATGLAPQVLKDAVDHLDTFGLAHLRILRGAKPQQTPRGMAVPVHVQATKLGRELLGVVEAVRETLRAHAKVLPSATKERWLTA